MLGAFRFDRATGQLSDTDGAIVHLRRQSADVLTVLASRVGDIVSKDTLFESVWPGIATTDDSLVQCISDIRRVLGPGIVETFPKKGYRLGHTATTKTSPPLTNRRPMMSLAAVSILVAIGLFVFMQSDKPPLQDTKAINPSAALANNTLAVLPFVSLSAGSDLQFFGDGLSEDIATDLSNVPKLTVISQASSFDYPAAESGFDEIADELGVRYLVRGTVRHNADRIRITVSLIDTRDGVNVWAERFDRNKLNPLDVQAEVTRKIVEALSLTLKSGERSPRHIEPDAYLMLLRGLEPLRSLTAKGNLEARIFFENAVELDPDYARAYANIAITYGREVDGLSSKQSSTLSIERGLEAAVTAIQLDPDIPHAYFALGVLNLATEQYDTALSAARHAIKLNGNYSDGHSLLAEISLYGGDLEVALSAIQRAKILHPHHPISFHWIEGQILYLLGRHLDAQPLLEAAYEDNPNFVQGQIFLAANYGQQDNPKAAANSLHSFLTTHPNLSLEQELLRMPFQDDERREQLIAGLEKANLFE